MSWSGYKKGALRWEKRQKCKKGRNAFGAPALSEVQQIDYLRAKRLRPSTPRPISAEPSRAMVAGSGVLFGGGVANTPLKPTAPVDPPVWVKVTARRAGPLV